MKRRFSKLLIREKLLLIITLTSLVTLLLAFLAFSINNVFFFDLKQKNKLNILAQVIANNSQAALSFNDPAAGEEFLAALKAEPHIVGAAIYTRGGRLFARFRNLDKTPAAPAGEKPFQKHFYEEWHTHTYWPIHLDGEWLGTVYLKTDTGELQEIIRKYLLYGLMIILLCLGAGFPLASRLQNSISKPIADLTGLAEKVSRDKNYGLRAVKQNEDELGELMERFNEMLSEIQKREEALVHSNEALTRSNRDLEQFAYVASHDLQEPLRMVTSYVDLLAARVRDNLDTETREFLGYITEGATRSRQLISDLLQYARVGREVKSEKVDAEEMLRKALDNLKVAIEETGALVTHDPLPMVYSDPVKLWQVFQNLIGNALKFHGQDKPRIHIGVQRSGLMCKFLIKDNGIGIDPKFLDKIFVIFKRLHSRDKYAGTGIGLAICKKIVEQHGGTIGAESKPGLGSTFYFTLPAA